MQGATPPLCWTLFPLHVPNPSSRFCENWGLRRPDAFHFSLSAFLLPKPWGNGKFLEMAKKAWGLLPSRATLLSFQPPVNRLLGQRVERAPFFQAGAVFIYLICPGEWPRGAQNAAICQVRDSQWQLWRFPRRTENGWAYAHVSRIAESFILGQRIG